MRKAGKRVEHGLKCWKRVGQVEKAGGEGTEISLQHVLCT